MNKSALSYSRATHALFVLSILGSMVACGKKPPQMPDPGPVRVEVITVRETESRQTSDRVGEVRSLTEVQLRPRINAIVLEQHFQDGARVNKGDLLFTLDAREYRAQAASAAARVASAEANLARAKQDVARYAPLLADEAISQQVYDNAVTAERQAEAEVAAQLAGLAETRLGVEYAKVQAPIAGRIGAAEAFPGDFVAAGQTVLATLSNDDPAYVSFSISESTLLAVEKKFRGLEVPDTHPLRRVKLVLADGTVYPHEGIINFIDRALDPTTGTFSLRARFPNPDYRLIPGLFARVRVSGELDKASILVPDRAVQELLGRYYVLVVGADEKIERRTVVPGERIGNQWRIREGLATGDRVVVEGLQKAREGVTVQVAPYTGEEAASEAAAPSTPAASG